MPGQPPSLTSFRVKSGNCRRTAAGVPGPEFSVGAIITTIVVIDAGQELLAGRHLRCAESDHPLLPWLFLMGERTV